MEEIEILYGYKMTHDTGFLDGLPTLFKQEETINPFILKMKNKD